ncbi:5-formyltetrahydrofolate cyclo-ligase [Roseibacillus ishigakijimensis]|nr:5-formyltetrahydrofolate cyclo-ligase [Roseibacillus ishigakijimensis]
MVTPPPKKRLRELARKTLARLSRSEHERRSSELVHRLAEYIKSRFPNARRIGTYAAMANEPDIALLAKLLPDRQFAYPLVLNRYEIAFHVVTDPATLEKGTFGIREPQPRIHPHLAAQDLDLVLVPGLSFDLKGRRLGQGAGYYDRFLAEIPMTPTIGITYSSQLLPRVPAEPHDRSMDYLASDRGVIPI